MLWFLKNSIIEAVSSRYYPITISKQSKDKARKILQPYLSLIKETVKKIFGYEGVKDPKKDFVFKDGLKFI